MPTLHPFLWNNGEMSDLGNLGGTLSGAQCANTRGDVIGSSTLPADLVSHAFLWRNGVMTDLGTLGGDNSEAIWINERGDVAGSADLPGFNLHDAVVWKDGKMIDLGTVGTDACSRGRGINSRGQVVGGSSDCANFLHAFVWNGSGPMLDLNTLIAPGSGLQLTNAININDRGEILAKSIPVGVTPVDDEDLGHLVLLIPCGAGDNPECKAEEGTQSNVTQASKTSRRSVPAILPARPRTAKDVAAAWQAKLLRQYHFPAIGQK
jgi:probable HAF family extracellular repeat protein